MTEAAVWQQTAAALPRVAGGRAAFFLLRCLLFGQMERMELSEHCERLLAAVWNYKTELANSSDVDSNAKFGKLMTKLEELSFQLAERSADFNILAGKHQSRHRTLGLCVWPH